MKGALLHLNEALTAKGPYMLLLVSLLLPFLAYQVSASYRIDIGEPADQHYLEGFYFAEETAGASVRWSGPRATILFPGIGGNQTLVLRLRLSALRPERPAQVLLKANGHPFAQFSPGGGMMSYDFLIGRGAMGLGGDLRLEMESDSFRAPPDTRELGLLMDWVQAESFGRSLVLPPARFLYLAASAMLLFLLLRRLAFSETVSLSAGLLLVFLASLGLARYRMGLNREFLPLAASSVAGFLALLLIGRLVVEQMADQRRNWLGLGLTLALALGVCWLTYQQVLLQNGPFGWDEAEHSMTGHYIAADLRERRFRSLWVDTHAQVVWPPLYSWMQGLLFLALGETMANARLLSLICLFLSAILLYLISTELEREKGWLMGVLAAGLMLTSLGTLQLAGEAMTELPSAFMVLLTLFAFLKASPESFPRRYLAVGIFAVLTFLLKYNYALTLMAVLVVEDLWERNIILEKGRERIGVSFQRENLLYLYLPIALGLAFWFSISFPEKRTGFFWFLTNHPGNRPFLSRENLLFYWRVIAREHAVSIPILVLSVAGFLYSFRHAREAGVRKVAILCALGLISSILHPLKRPRYLQPFLPPCWVLAAYGMVQGGGWLAGRIRLPWARQGARIALAALVLSLALPGAWQLYSQRLGPTQTYGEGGRDVSDILQAMKERIEPWRPLLVIGNFAELSPGLVRWTLAIDPRYEDKFVDFQYELPPFHEPYDVRLERWLSDRHHFAVATLEVGERSPFNTPDYRAFNSWRYNYVQAMEKLPGWQVTYEQYYPSTDLRVRIYRWAQREG